MPVPGLLQNVASQNLTFCLVNATTGAGLTGATVTTKTALDGTQSAGTGTVTELGSGQYKYVPAQAETNGTTVGFLFTATNAVPVNLHCFITSAVLPANVTQIDGNATNGNNATLNLLKLNIVNNAGDAIVASSTGSNGSGINASGNGSGHGVLATGGTTGHGVSGVGGATSGNGVRATGTAGNSAALNLVGQGSAAGLLTTGGATGAGLKSVGGATSGHGADIQAATLGAGMVVTGSGTGQAGMRVVSTGATAAGLEIVTQTSGDGVSIAPTTGRGIFVSSDGTGTTKACIELSPNANAPCLKMSVAAGGSSPTISIAAPAATGATAAGAAVQITGGTASTTGGGTSSEAIKLIGGAGAASTNGASAALTATGGGTTTVTGGNGATFTGTGNLHGLAAAGAGTGRAISAANSDIFSMTDGVETGLTPLQEMRLTAAASAGKLSGAATTTVTIRNAVADSKNRVVATVDSDGNRTAVTTDVT